MSDSKVINFAILGAGNIAGAMAKAISGISDKVHAYAVASRNLTKAQKFAEQWGFEKAYGSYDELVKDENIDLIYIATPHSEHYKNAMMCIEHGQNLLVEKAFCANLKQTREVIAAAKAKGTFLAEAMWTRYEPSRQIIKDVIDSGRLGNVHYMEADFSFGGRGIDRLEKPELCGGALLDVGIYSLTMALMYLGSDIKEIKTSCVKNELGVDLHNETILVYKNNNMAKIKSGVDVEKYSNYCKVVGDKGYMYFEEVNVPTWYEIYDVEGNLQEHVDLPVMVNGYEYEVLECREQILSGNTEAISINLYETCRVMGMMDSLRNQWDMLYPWEEKADIDHDIEAIWGESVKFNTEDVWDRSNTRSFLEVYDTVSGEVSTLATFEKVIEAPNWSHNGEFMVYNSEGHVYKFDLATRESTLIETEGLCTINNDHVLSSDDSRISVSDETSPDHKSRIYTVGIEDGKVELITENAPSYLHGITPDDKIYCYCAERGGEYDVYTINKGGKVETRLTTAPCLNDGCEYDTKGEYIYFNSVRTGLMQAWRMKANGQDQEQLTFDNHLNTWFPHISPDGSKIAMISYYKGDLWPGDHVPNRMVELRLMNSDGSSLKTVVKLFGGQGTINVNSWSPDSTKFAYVRYEKLDR